MSHFATNWAIQQRGLKPATKIVLWHLCDRHNPDFGCFPTQARLAGDCEISRSALNDHLRKLELAGLIRRCASIDPVTKRQQPTRYILGFENGFDDPNSDPSPEIGHGDFGEDPGCALGGERSLVSPDEANPCADSAHGAVSGFQPEPCPKNDDFRVRNPDTNPVREPLSEPVKEEEDARARDDRFEEFFAKLLGALGFDADAALPGWWQGWAPREHVRRWVTDLGLTEDRSIAVARDSREHHPAPPDGPRALDRAMKRAARSVEAKPPDGDKRRKRSAKPADAPRASLDEIVGFYAGLVNGDGYLPRNAISNTVRDAMRERGMVTTERLRERGGAMSIHHRFPNRRSRTCRALGVQQALEWAFRTEKARLELPEPPDPERGDRPGYGLEYVLMQRAALGCRIDGGRYKPDSSTHEDAEVIAASVAGLSTSLGGLRMAICIAELARAGMTPDWMPGAVPRCVPVEMKRNQHGARSITVPVGTCRMLIRGKWRTVELRACPVTWSPHPDQIAAAHRHYEHWWLALEWVREGLLAGGMLREISVIDEMPAPTPWSGATSVG